MESSRRFGKIWIQMYMWMQEEIALMESFIISSAVITCKNMSGAF